MSTIRTRRINERLEPYRIVDAQFTYGPDWFKLEDYVLHGYLSGERMDMINGLSLDHFDEIHYITQSHNAKNNRLFFHAVGVRYSGEKRQTVLILRRK